MPVWRPPAAWCATTGVELGPGARVVVMPDTGGVARALIGRLHKRGVDALVMEGAPEREALARKLEDWARQGPVTGVYWLPALDGHPDVAHLDYGAWREGLRVRVKLLHTTLRTLDGVLSGAGRFVVAATRLGGRHGYDEAGAVYPMGGAVSGVIKAYRRERPDTLCKVVDFAVSRKTAALADRLIDETLRDPGAVEIGTAGGSRWSVGLIEQPDGNRAKAVTLDTQTVFLVTGAAGSIVSAIVGDLAAASAGTFHLLDLTPEPAPDDPDIASFRTDREGLQRALFERLKAGGQRVRPVLVERALARIERAAAALEAIRAVEQSGGRAYWHQVDLCDPAEVATVMEAIHATSGRVDVLIHAAGLEISRFVADKTPAEFDRVFDVKSDGWYGLMHGLKKVPLRAAIVFSSVAGRFGNAGQTDYSAANDLLCKSVSGLRQTRPDTLGLAIDWTAWDRIGMASRGSIRTTMKAAGIDMLAPEAGIPIVRRELSRGSAACEVVIAQALGDLDEDATPAGGLDLERLPARIAGPMLGRVIGMGPCRGLTVETELDPAEQPFLHDHQINGKPVLPGVMGLEAFAELATLLLPDWQIADIEDVRFHAPCKFFRGEPRQLRITAQITPDGPELLARCALVGLRTLKLDAEPTQTTHFTAVVRLSHQPPGAVRAERPEPAVGAAIHANEVYRIYTHGPAYQVLDSAWGDGPGTLIGRMAADLPPNHTPGGLPLEIAPRHIELCFQTAGMLELGSEGRFGLPARVGRVVKLKDPGHDTILYSVVHRAGNDAGFDADVVDANGEVYLRVEAYQTSELPEFASAEQLKAIRAVVSPD
jgi:NAD(P)-dependent dehydrogenase (short-subunit alcohol dehydrogenase family)